MPADNGTRTFLIKQVPRAEMRRGSRLLKDWQKLFVSNGFGCSAWSPGRRNSAVPHDTFGMAAIYTIVQSSGRESNVL